MLTREAQHHRDVNSSLVQSQIATHTDGTADYNNNSADQSAARTQKRKDLSGPDNRHGRRREEKRNDEDDRATEVETSKMMKEVNTYQLDPQKTEISTKRITAKDERGNQPRRRKHENDVSQTTDTQGPPPSVEATRPQDVQPSGPEAPTGQVHNPDYDTWPTPNGNMDPEMARIYNAVKRTKAHNHVTAKLPLPSGLNINNWKQETTGHSNDQIVINGIQYGFPVQYMGPPRHDSAGTPNHASAAHHRKYIEKETAYYALSGPYNTPPFSPWFTTSPLMTRDKTDSSERRVIVDLSYPDGGVNMHIQPHMYQGAEVAHNLPTIDSAVNAIATSPPGEVNMAVIDLSRAYRHFPVSPLDWPLLGILAEGKYHFDMRTPFGSRMSSFVMQTVADFIVRALKTRGIKAYMYLDDIVLIAPTKNMAERQYNETIHLLTALGLEVAASKLQPPATRVKWLGIIMDVGKNELSIPRSKMEEVKRCMAAASNRKAIPKKHLQSIIGMANHISKIVRAARVFICRLLAALRAAEGNMIRITHHVQRDLEWYASYLANYNGRAIIPNNRIVRRIWADACLKGAGASDGQNCYMYTFPQRVTQDHHISKLEALNCLAAVRALVTTKDAGGTIEVFCDNRPAVDALTSGRARDAVLAACARAMWFKAAETDTNIVFTHMPGEAMALPDTLSRAAMTRDDCSRAWGYIRSIPLGVMSPKAEWFDYSKFV